MNKTILTSAAVSILVSTGILALGLWIFESFGSTTIYIQNTAPVEVRTVIITGYSSETSQTDETPFLTASQTSVRKGIIACPRNLAFGTVVEIEGIKYTCEDRMNQKYNDRFDIWFASAEEALKWGKQIKTVVVYK